MLKSNEPEKLEKALPCLNQLILKSSTLELFENQKELANLLLLLQDNFELPDFDQNVTNALFSLILKTPDPTISILSSIFYKKETNLYSQMRLLRSYMAIVLMFVQNKENLTNQRNLFNLSTMFGHTLLKPLNSTDIYEKIFKDAIFRPVGQMLVKNLCIFARVSNDLSLLNQTAKLIMSLKKNLTIFGAEIRVGLRFLIEGYQAKNAMSSELMELMEFGEGIYR